MLLKYSNQFDIIYKFRVWKTKRIWISLEPKDIPFTREKQQAKLAEKLLGRELKKEKLEMPYQTERMGLI